VSLAIPNSKALIATIIAIAIIAGVAAGLYLTNQPSGEVQKVRLLVATAGDVNMLALFQNVVAPEFEKRYPQVEVSVIHTGPGDAGSRTIFEKLKAAKDAGKACWDIDVAIVHQIFMTWAMQEDILLPYAKNLSTWKYAKDFDIAKNALGVNVEGYVMPMFRSQIAIAYNPKYVPNPPKSYEELVEWVKQHPRKFGYNGIKGGMSGVGFVVGWVYWKTGLYDVYAKGPFDEKHMAGWEKVFQELKEFNKYVRITAGNVGTLDMLNKEEIWMGPVWVDMFYTFISEGKLNPNMRLILISPGLPGQPMYFVIPKKPCNLEWALKFVEFMTSPEIQAKIIVEKYNWYPGIDPNAVMPYVSEEAKQRLFRDITPEDLKTKGLVFPLNRYYQEMLNAYIKYVEGG